MRIFLSAAAFFAMSVTPCLAQDWVKEDLSNNEGVIYRPSNNPNGPMIHAVTISDIEGSCSCNLDKEGGPTDEGRFEYAISTMSMDLYGFSVTKHNSTPHFVGEVYTAEGERKIMAGFYDGGAEAELRVYLDEPDNFSLSAAKRALTALDSGGAAPMQQAKAQAHAQAKSQMPAQSRPSAKATAASKPKSGYISGADLLAGVKRDVEAPEKARKIKREKAEKVALDKALRDAVISGGYAAPVIVKPRKGPRKIMNWVEVEPGRYVAKANDRHSPQFIDMRGTKQNPPWNKAAGFKMVLKDAGLTSPKIQGPEVLEIAKAMVGVNSAVAAGTAKRNGKPVRFFASYSYDPEDQTSSMAVYDAPLHQWRDWGGLAVPFIRAGVYEQTEFTPGALAQLRQMSPSEDLKVYEEHYTALMTSLFQGTMMTNMATLNSMRSFNMSTATCAGVENCTVSPDGVGGYEAVID